MELLDFTTASREQLEKVWRAIEKEMGDDRFFTMKELDALPGVLDVKEQVLAFSSGLHEGNTWLIVLTDQRVIFLDKGMLYGLRQSSIELERVNNVESSKGLMLGTISIGSNAETYRITNVWKSTVDPFVRKLREATKAKMSNTTLRSPGTEDALGLSEDASSEARDDQYDGLESGDYEVYTPPEESGPLALHALEGLTETQGPVQTNPDSMADANPALRRLAKAGLIPS